MCCATVQSGDIGVIERFGEYKRDAPPGLHCLMWPCEAIAGQVSTRIQQLEVVTVTKTKDNVGVTVRVAVQFIAKADMIYEAYYKLTNVDAQIQSYVDDVVRATLPTLELDAAYESKDHVADEVKNRLQEAMGTYGYEIVKALVTDLQPAPQVMAAMNEINTARRLREAATEKAEAEKILKVKQAEAEAEAAYLAGTGLARQRKALIDGMREGVEAFQKEIKGTTSADVMNMILVTQYIDMLKELGSHPNSKTVFIPHSPGNLHDIQQQISMGIMQGGQVPQQIAMK
jgi:regulator of protease activity HflC (stomatin/prohibitin superfamily)